MAAAAGGGERAILLHKPPRGVGRAPI